jgi:peptidoglycan/LPS O-acetylase OafA/YrhL
VSDVAGARQSTRIPSLDGLRGVAALIVVFHHLSLLLAPIAATYFDPRGQEAHPPVWSAYWWVTSTPAQLIVAGPEAVLVFFVLSGLVVAMPVLNRPSFSWISYYPQRMARLYIPAASSVLFAVLLISAAGAFSAEPSGTSASGWSLRSPTWQTIVGSFDLIFGNTKINDPLWTLRWEVVFSILLPLFVIAAVIGKRYWLILGIGAGVVTVVGAYSPAIPSFLYLPVFFLGTIIAVKFKEIGAWVSNPSRARLVRWAGLALLIASVLTATLHATAVGLFPGKYRVQGAASSIQFVGCVGLVLVAAFWQPAVRMLSMSFFRWLGRVSFGLYLVHVPVIVAVDTIAGPGREFQTIGIGLALSLVAAEIFTRVIETPSHRLSKRIGAASSAALSEWFASPEAPFPRESRGCVANPKAPAKPVPEA